MRCLIVDDDEETCTFLGRALAQAGYTVGVGGDAAACLAQVAAREWDVLVLDRMLPGELDGLALLARLRAEGRKFPVLFLSALGDVDERVRGLRAGADDYLGKPFEVAELTARLESLVRRARTAQAPRVLRADDLELDPVTFRVQRGGQRLVLQPREFRLLEFLLRNGGKVVTRRMLLEHVWDYRFDPQTNVIDVQISRLRAKIDRATDRPLIHTVRGEGYMLRAPEPTALD